MTNKRIAWTSLRPDLTSYKEIFDNAAKLPLVTFADMQPRLKNALELFCDTKSSRHFMLLKAKGVWSYLSLIADTLYHILPEYDNHKGVHYVVHGSSVDIEEIPQGNKPFAVRERCVFQEWVESEQLFGCVRIYNNNINLQSGLVHKANGGVLILSASTLLAQPLLWLRLKRMINQSQFYWVSPDEAHPLPITIPFMPLELGLIIVDDRHGLADFYDMEPEISEQAIYGECEDFFQIKEIDDMSQWCGYVNQFLLKEKLPALSADAWKPLITHAVRYSGDKSLLPLSPTWLYQQLSEAAAYSTENTITSKSLKVAMSNREWRESYLQECVQSEIELGQILIDTEGEKIGQINGLSILDYPGYPRRLAEPSRISCVVYFGDGEVTDVERKAELGGNLHAKGMMIMQAFLISELALDQLPPFSASIVSEQSYGEVDGDSASLATLCVLISALSKKPINQQIAVTGSVDQFGNVQPIGGINEKIEGFFEVCLRRGLTGKQGVIVPATNMRHLCLNKNIINAVREETFHIWAVSSAKEALLLLTGCPYSHQKQPNLLAAMQDRISKVHSRDCRRFPWVLRWLSWCNFY